MPRLIRTVRTLTLVSLGAFVAPLVGQAPPTAAPAPAPAPPPSFKLSGYAEASYIYSTQPVGNTVVGRLYDRYSDAFTLNALKLTADRAYNAKKLDAGVHADVLVGQNATLLRSSGFDLGTDGDITQLYVTLNLPTKNGSGV